MQSNSPQPPGSEQLGARYTGPFVGGIINCMYWIPQCSFGEWGESLLPLERHERCLISPSKVCDLMCDSPRDRRRWRRPLFVGEAAHDGVDFCAFKQQIVRNYLGDSTDFSRYGRAGWDFGLHSRASYGQPGVLMVTRRSGSPCLMGSRWVATGTRTFGPDVEHAIMTVRTVSHSGYMISSIASLLLALRVKSRSARSRRRRSGRS